MFFNAAEAGSTETADVITAAAHSAAMTFELFIILSSDFST